MTGRFSLVAVQASPLGFTGSIDAFSEDVAGVVSRHPAAQMVIYPELHLFHRPLSQASKPPSESDLASVPLDGEFVHSLCAIAKSHGIWLIPGTINERGKDGKLYNTAIVVNPSGHIVATYRKMFPWRPFEPHTPGSTFVVFDVPGVGTIGLNTCYDIWFPETCRHLAWMGADLIINLVKTTTPDRTQELVLVRANAIMNQVPIVSANSAGPVGYGCSLIVGPEGEVITDAMHTDRAELDFSFDRGRVDEVRAHGTAGTNKMWEQFRPGDKPIDLPLYGGQIDPARWTPVRRLPQN